MGTLLLIHGPNLNLLGKREAAHYGTTTLEGIELLVAEEAKKIGHDIHIKSFQSNHEGALIDFLQKESANAAGIIINPGALTHYSYALYDALLDTKLPAVEVHLSNIDSREEWRRHSVTSPACIAQIVGHGPEGYAEALQKLHKHIQKTHS